MSSVAASSRFTRRNPCPICSGFDQAARGENRRCYGYLSSDGEYAHCTREELAGGIEQTSGSETYAHRLEGPCKCGQTHGFAAPALRAVAMPSEPRAPISATYDYRDEQGVLLFQVVRRADKSFQQRRPDGNGDWLWQLGDTRRVLYRLPDLLTADPSRIVWVVEGEKDVDTAYTVGLVATCNPHGAGKWRSEFTQALRGRHVVVIPDGDTPGQKHAATVAAELTGVAASVHTLTLPAKDFTDWVQAGGNMDQLRDLLRASKAQADDSRPRLDAHPISELLKKTFPPPKWAVPDIIPHGLTLLAGNPKSGKSFLMLQICLGIAHGGYVLGNIPVEQGNVLYIDMENGEELLQERIIAALFGKTPPASFEYVTTAPTLDNGLLDLIRDYMRRRPNTRLIVIDTFEAVRPPETGRNVNAYRADYAALRPLADVAKEVRCSIVVVHHLSKGSGQVEDIFSHINGSYGLNGAVDNLMVLGKMGNITALSAKGRRVKPLEKKLDWDTQTMQWTDGGDAVEAKLSDTKVQILQILEDAGEPLYPSDIAGRAGLKADVVRQRLHHMAKKGEVISHRQKYQSNPFTHNSRNARNVQEENGVTTGSAVVTPRVTPHNEESSRNAPRNADSLLNVTDVTGVTTFSDLESNPFPPAWGNDDEF